MKKLLLIISILTTQIFATTLFDDTNTKYSGFGSPILQLNNQRKGMGGG
jgi:hypothetical protein